MLAETKKHIANVLPVALGAAVVVAALLWYAQLTHTQRTGEELYTVSGTAVEVALAQRVVTLEDEAGREFSVTLLPETRILDENGDAAALSYIRKGFQVSITGPLDEERALVPVEVRVIKKK